MIIGVGPAACRILLLCLKNLGKCKCLLYGRTVTVTATICSFFLSKSEATVVSMSLCQAQFSNEVKELELFVRKDLP
jgi:hypothetical protein